MAAKNTYDVVLEKVSNQQLKTTKALCSALGLGLAAAKGMVDKAPTTVAKGLDKDKALALKKELEALGNTVSIPGMETKTEAPATKKTTTTKKQTTKKSAPSPSKVATPSNDDFDAIFGGDTAQKTTKTTKAKSAPKATTKKATAASDEAFDEIFGDSTPKAETKSKAKKSTPKVLDKQVVVGEYFEELAQLRQGIKETGTYSGDGDMKPEIALAVYGDMDAVFSSFKRETLSGYMRIARSDLEKQYKKLNKKIEKMKKASRYDKAKKCFSDDDRLVPCVSYELAMLNLRAGMPDSYINMMTTTALDGDPRAITYCQDYFSTNSEKANPYSEAIETHNIRLNGKFDFYEMFFYAIRGIGFDFSPYYPDSEIAIPGWEFGRVNIEIQRTEALEKLYQTLAYFVIPENIGTAEYKEHFGNFTPSELQIKIARQWFFIDDDRLIMSEETKKLRDELRTKITDAICDAPQMSANVSDQKVSVASAVPAVSAEVKRAPKGKIERKEFSNGSYEGEMKDGKFHGYGVYRWNNGNSYDGEWENGNFHGHGIFRWADGDMYDGEWKNDKRHGNGKWFNADGSYYTGVWEDGTVVSSTEMVTSSEKVTGVKRERVEYDNGSYEGEIVDGLRHGKGKYTWSNGSEYEGDWVKGKRCGFGVYKSYGKNEVDGTTFMSYIYEGEWKDSKQHGYGVAKGYKVFPRFGHVFMKWSYDGPWVDDKKHGRGVYRDWDGNALSEHWKVYEGEWIDDKRHGLFVWRPEPAAKDLKYIDYYDHGKEVVGYIDYDPSIKTLEDAHRAKETEREENERVMEERRAREAAQRNSYSNTSSSSDNEIVWEKFESAEDLIRKLKNPELFDDPEDRWIANSSQYFESFVNQIREEFNSSDFSAATDIFTDILILDYEGLMDYLTNSLGNIESHSFAEYMSCCLTYANTYIGDNSLIPLANLTYYWSNECGINKMENFVGVNVYSLLSINEYSALWFERYAASGNGAIALEYDPLNNEALYGDKLDQMLEEGYLMGSDCCLFLSNKTESEYEPPEIEEYYKIEKLLKHIFCIGEWEPEDKDYTFYKTGSFAMDSYMDWLEHTNEYGVRERADGTYESRLISKGNYSLRKRALEPLQNFLSDAKQAHTRLRNGVPQSDRSAFDSSVGFYILLADAYVEQGQHEMAFLALAEAYNHGYDIKHLGKVCGDIAMPVLMKDESHWYFDDPYVNILKIAVVCSPRDYLEFHNKIAVDSYGNYSTDYLIELLLDKCAL